MKRCYTTILLAGLALAMRPAVAQTTQPAASEGRWLKNVRQLTSKEQGLDRAGEAYFSRDMQRISFQAYPAGKEAYQIYALNIDGTGLKRISNGEGACTCSYFHPRGEKMIFASNFADQRPPEQGIPARASASSRPAEPAAATGSASAAGRPGGPAGQGARGGGAGHGGGRSYAWEYFPGMDIYEYTFTTGAVQNLTHTDGYDAEGSYSPDGRQIVFSSFRDGTQRVYIMNADGSDPHPISSGPGDGGPFFSPDGQRVVYRGDRKGDQNMQIFVNNLAGTAEKAITPDTALYWCPYWHPSGQWLAFTYMDTKQMPPRFDVYLVRDDGSQMQRVTSDGSFNALPVFSPDGKYLMWTSKRGTATDAPQIFLAEFVGLTAKGELQAK